MDTERLPIFLWLNLFYITIFPKTIISVHNNGNSNFQGRMRISDLFFARREDALGPEFSSAAEAVFPGPLTE
jgi:hypothetical protein